MKKLTHSESEIVKSVNELEFQLKRLKELEEENSKLKKMYANLALDNAMPAKRVIRFMEEIICEKGKPDNIRRDNGPEFISHEFQEWCKGNGMISPRIMFQMSTPKMRSKKEESSCIKESSASCCEKRTGVLTAAPRLFIFNSEQMCRFDLQREYV